MSFEWDDEVVVKFLEEYRQHECLWNPYHRNFTDCYARNEALKKIVRALRADLTVEDCLKILRCIRKKLSLWQLLRYQNKLIHNILIKNSSPTVQVLRRANEEFNSSFKTSIEMALHCGVDAGNNSSRWGRTGRQEEKQETAGTKSQDVVSAYH